jgi:hypothetical protein
MACKRESISASIFRHFQALFKKYFDLVLIPAVESNYRLPGCEKKPALLFAIIVECIVQMTF